MNSDARSTLGLGPSHSIRVEHLEFAGLALEPEQDGGVAARIDRLVARRAHVQGPASSLDIGLIELSDVAARLSGPDAERRPQLLELSAREIRMQEADLVIRGLPSPFGGLPDALRLEALDDLDGLVRAFITDALWLVDAEIVVPVENGEIDFNRVEVEHIGPNSTIGIGPSGVHIDAPHGARIDLLAFDRGAIPVATEGGRLGDRGRLAVGALLQALLQAPPAAPVARVADARLEGPLQRTRLSGELRLGDGALGTSARHVVLTGREQESNRVDLSSPALADELVVRIPRFGATAATFALPGRTVQATRVTAAIVARIIGGDGGRTARLDYRGAHVTISDATLGEVKIAPVPSGRAS